MNELKYLVEFQKLLADYRMSEQSKKTLAETKLVLLLAPTSTGRNTIIRELVKTGKYGFIVSDTTRKPRINDGMHEQDGVEYWFRSEEEVLDDLRAGKYIEAELIHDQQVSGMSVREINKIHAEDKIGITDIDIKGMQYVADAKPDTTTILLLPPGFDEWQRRIKGRGHMDSGEYKRRLETARNIFQIALEDSRLHIVINDDLAEAVRMIDGIAHSNQDSSGSRERGRILAEELYRATQAHLSGQSA